MVMGETNSPLHVWNVFNSVNEEKNGIYVIIWSSKQIMGQEGSSNSINRCHPIEVDDEYECVNGLIGVNRDIVMKLLKIFRTELFSGEEKIRSVIDIGEIMYLWSEQRVFQFVRKIDKKGADQEVVVNRSDLTEFSSGKRKVFYENEKGTFHGRIRRGGEKGMES